MMCGCPLVHRMTHGLHMTCCSVLSVPTVAAAPQSASAGQAGQKAPLFSGGEVMDLRNMILAMVDEPLVLVVKLADRLHNMRTVFALRPDRQRAVAAETMQVWCSLAERLGMFSLKVRPASACPVMTPCVGLVQHT